MPTTERELFSCKTGFQFSIYSYRDFAQHEAWVWRDNIILVSAAFRLFRMWREKISFLASSIECDFTSGWISLCFFCIREQHSSSISGTMMISRIQKQTSSRPKWECRTWNLWHFPIISILSFLTVDACWWFWHLFFCYACCVYFSFLNRSECCCRLWRRARLKTSAKCFAFQLSVWLLCLHLIKIKSKAFLHFIYFIMPNWISQSLFSFFLHFAHSRSRCEQFSRAETKRTLNKRK